jgi:hypothetical protein
MIASASSGNGAAPKASSQRARAERPSPEQNMSADPHPLEPLLNQLAMLREFALHYVEAQKDATKSAVRRLIIQAIICVIAALVGGTIVIASAVMVADGLAELVSWAAGGPAWIGKLVVGSGMLLALGLASWLFISRTMRTQRERIIRKYESLHHAQRSKFSADVAQRAAL